MGSNIQFGAGVQRLIDAQQRFTRCSYPVYLRLRNFVIPQQSLYEEMGFRSFPVSGQTGTWDILIDPPPGVYPVSVHNIGQSGGKLRFGARVFNISASFVDAQTAPDVEGVQGAFWRQPNVVGLFTEKMLFSVEDIKHQEVAGKTVFWVLVCNANELR